MGHQQTAQLDMLTKEKERAIKMMTTQYEQQYTQQKLAIEQAHKQQENQLEMARAQRDMAISQQAHQYGTGPAVQDADGHAEEHGGGLRQRVQRRHGYDRDGGHEEDDEDPEEAVRLRTCDL